MKSRSMSPPSRLPPGGCRRGRDRGRPVGASDVDLARAGSAGRRGGRSGVRRSVPVGLSRRSLLGRSLLGRSLLRGSLLNRSLLDRNRGFLRAAVRERFLGGDGIGAGVLCQRAQRALSECEREQEHERDERGEPALGSSPAVPRVRSGTHPPPPTGVCAASLPYGPGPRPTAYTVVLLPRKVTPPSGGHIGRTAPRLQADGVVRSEESDCGGRPTDRARQKREHWRKDRRGSAGSLGSDDRFPALDC